MCGRFTLVSPARQLVDFFSLLEPEFDLAPRYNIAPTQSVACIRNIDGFRKLSLMRWGLLPFFAKHVSEGVRMINARSETIDTKPAFRRSFESQRCLIPADGFFEWKKNGTDKQPYLIRMKSEEPFAFAGIWDRWTNPETDEVIESCSVLTTSPNRLMESIHDRMPVILSDGSATQWLAEASKPSQLQSILQPFNDAQMEAFPVHRSVGNVRNDTPLCISRIETRTQRELF